MDSDNYRTRFAPSPTGNLHIGSARTALFNYVVAKKSKGSFILRFEDTDSTRNIEETIQNLFTDLSWLKMIPDESIFNDDLENNFGPYKQMERLGIYEEEYKKLLDEKKIYRCFCTKKELIDEKKLFISLNKKKNYKYSRKCANLKNEEINKLIIEKKEFVLRAKINEKKNYAFNDIVRGIIEFSGKEIEDFIIVRNNGIPNYNFSCVIDDYKMKITHVLRGEEHLSNTAKQLILYDMFGWKKPNFGHISAILDENKKKLSKRGEKNNLNLIKNLRDLGYLPEAIINHLMFLGYHPKNEKKEEFFSLEEFIEEFDTKNLNSSSAMFSIEKLNWYNNSYIKRMGEKKFIDHSWKFTKEKLNLKEEKDKEYFSKVILLFKKQINNFSELFHLSRYFFSSFFNEKGKETKKINDNSEIIKKFIYEITKENENWKEEEIEKKMNFLLEKMPHKSKKEIFSYIRKSLIYNEKGPELKKIIFIIGKNETIRRLKTYIN